MTNQNVHRGSRFGARHGSGGLRWRQFAGADSALGGPGAAPAACANSNYAHNFHLAC